MDLRLADWLNSNGHLCTPSRVAGWRSAGMFPLPTVLGVREASRPGRPAADWSDADFLDVQAIALRLLSLTGRGKNTTAAVLTMADEGLPVPPATVLRAARTVVSEMTRGLVAELQVPSGLGRINPDDPEEIREIVDGYVVDHPALERTIARRLRGTAAMDSDADAQSVATLLLEALLGLGPDPSDSDALELTLQSLDLHGLTRPVGGPGGPRVLTGGVAAAAQAIGRFGLNNLSQLVDAMRPEDVHTSLRATRELGHALAAVPADLAYHLAAGALATFLNDPSPTSVALRLVCWQALRQDREGEPDASPITDAIRAQGWLTD